MGVSENGRLPTKCQWISEYDDHPKAILLEKFRIVIDPEDGDTYYYNASIEETIGPIGKKLFNPLPGRVYVNFGGGTSTKCGIFLHENDFSSYGTELGSSQFMAEEKVIRAIVRVEWKLIKHNKTKLFRIRRCNTREC